ncbi:MAG: hypothetical protein QG583_375 [Patescibacteria group bacterium]|nr:hypothetical protein [Patescibacteria group bacterium]
MLIAQMAELVDAMDSKSIDGNIMRVRFSLWAQYKIIHSLYLQYIIYDIICIYGE